ncbi:hypothetical protein HPB48_022646 [Haemaphysalis longicornis]|uniref:Uncharacterized protein n=1 Tax=Haemaphysalis longicornis TaxID=44386 RepID=A0A9J6G904_HAELO|nr:hypothetical protein HPB48_022646 [Haemaphysalis longicornis]
MHPERNVGRRKAMGASLLRLIHDDNKRARFVDASFNEQRAALAVVVADNEGMIVNAASVQTDRLAVAEHAAIALAQLDKCRPFVYSDSKSAVRALEKGSVGKFACRIMQICELLEHYLGWFPSHLEMIELAPLNLNESALEGARDLTLHSALRNGVAVLLESRKSPSTYNEVTKYYLFNHKVYGLPHPKLNSAQALTLHLLQTCTYPCPWRLNMFFPETYTEPYCMDSGNLATLEHMPLCSERIEDPAIKDASWWAAGLRSPVLDDQFWAIQQADYVGVRLGLPVWKWERPLSG